MPFEDITLHQWAAWLKVSRGQRAQKVALETQETMQVREKRAAVVPSYVSVSHNVETYAYALLRLNRPFRTEEEMYLMPDAYESRNVPGAARTTGSAIEVLVAESNKANGPPTATTAP